MATIFTKIVRGEIPSYRIAENEKFFAFLDINPLSKGHTLVIPKKETDYIFDLEDELLGELHVFAKKTALAIQKSIPCKRIGLVVYGLDVPHAHVHLIPLIEGGEINFSRPKLKFSEAEFQQIAQGIQQEFLQL